MIRKLLLLGIIVVAAIVVIPNIAKGSSEGKALETIKQKIDYATTDHAQTNGTAAAGYRSILTNSSALTADLMSNTLGGGTNRTAGKTGLLPQNTIRQTYAGQVFQETNGTCQVSVPGMAETINGQAELTRIIQVSDCTLPLNEPVQVTTTTQQNSFPSTGQGNLVQITPYANPGNDGSTNSAVTNTNQASLGSQNSGPSAPPYFQTIQLDAVNQGANTLLSYDDTTGKTIEVQVTMKNSDKTLFSGTFYTSQFHAEVNDVPNTPHIIEMTVQNGIYGTLHGSVYAPPTVQNSTISGIFTN